MSQSGSLINGGGPGTGIQTIVTDSGSISGSTVTIFANNVALNAGSSVEIDATSGTVAQLNVTDGQGNTIIGNLSGTIISKTTASLCTGLGTDCLAAITTDHYHTALGYRALKVANGAAENTACGFITMEAVTTGSGNVALGAYSGSGFTTGNYNCMIGYAAGQLLDTSDSNNVLLAHSGVTGESNAMRLGRTGSGSHQVDTTFIGGVIDTTTPTDDNHVMVINNDTEQVTIVPDGTSGQVLTTDGNGNLSWESLTTNVQVFTTSGTYTPTPGLMFVLVRISGGGGGGGGSPDLSTSVNFVGPAAGGGGGGYTEQVFPASSIGVSQPVTIGAGGTAGSATGGDGGNGGTTSFGSLLSATGGAGGLGTGSGVANDSVVNVSAGGIGGSGTSGYLNITGQFGGGCSGFTITTLSVANPAALVAEGGAGGSNPIGIGGAKVNAAANGQTGISGSPGTGFGGGGGGGASVYNPVAAGQAGGAGSGGVIIIQEFIIP